MRLVTTIARSLKYIFRNFSTGVCTLSENTMKRGDSLDMPTGSMSPMRVSIDMTSVTGGLDDYNAVKKKIQEFVPRLRTHLRKGDCGRIAIIGGSFEYTGAPYFAAISALKTGADLVHVFCSRDAGPILKTYSPELMVHPCLDTTEGLKIIEPWLEKFHVLVIGPGLGRNPGTFKNVSHIIGFCKKILRPAPPLILDADALHLIAEDLNLIKHYPGPLFLTPNNYEFTKLCNRASESNPTKLALFYGAIILQKGVVDVISNGFHTSKVAFTELAMSCSAAGTKRRCGGQGDILTGCLATLVTWCHNYLRSSMKFDFSKLDTEEASQFKPEYLKDVFMFYSSAVYGASFIARTSSKAAFEAKGRGMTATDIIQHIDKVFKTHFEV